MKYINDTIVASSSANVKQAIGIIRVSGEDTYELVNKVFSKNILKQEGNTLVKGYLTDLKKEPVDEVVLACYRAPRSFTGEDTIEINCHGGVLVINKIIQILMSIGLRHAEKGEFSKRAFLNNKINLIQAEAICDLIEAQNEHTLKTAMNSLGKTTTTLINHLSDELLELIALINVNIDYPEYDGVEDMTSTNTKLRLEKFLESIQTIQKHSQISQTIKEGIDTVIIGRPNVGKSSLLNALLKEDKAIVSEVQGTTRDLVEGKIHLGDITLNLIDTAGIRTTEDKIEQIGIQKSHQAIEQAKLIILVTDGTQEITPEDKKLLDLIKDKNYIIAINKSDLDIKLEMVKAVKISALNGDINNLINAIKENIMTTTIDFRNDLILSNVRQIACFNEIEINIAQALNDLKKGIPVDLAVIYLQKAWNLLLNVQGKDHEVNLIDEIFKRFCLGK